MDPGDVPAGKIAASKDAVMCAPGSGTENPPVSNDADRSLVAFNSSASGAVDILSSRRGKELRQGAPVGKADRAQGLGHRLRNGQAQSLPRRVHHTRVGSRIFRYRSITLQ